MKKFKTFPGILFYCLGVILLLQLAVFAQTAADTQITNIASVSFSDGTTTYTNQSNPVVITVAKVAGLTITPDAQTNSAVIPGQTGVTMTFRVTNTGNFTDDVIFGANGASLRVVGPATITAATVGSGSTNILTNGSAVTQSLAQNGFVDVTVTLSINSGATPGSTVQVLLGDASTNSPTFDNVASDSSANEVRTVSTGATNGSREARGDITVPVEVSDMTLTKSHSGNFTAGSTGTYNFQVNNTGNIPSSGTITVTDTLPSGLTVNGGTAGAVTPSGTNAANWTCNSNALNPQTVTCTSTTAIANGSSSVFNITVNVGLGTAVGTNSITNTATVSGGGQTNVTNDSSSDPTTVVGPDLTVSKTHSPATFIRGTTGDYSITVSNSGTAATSGTVTVTDTLPTGLSIADGAVTLSGANAANWTCNAASNVITCTSSTAIAVSGTSVFGFTVNVASNAAASVTNNVSVSGGNEPTSNNGNNTGSDPTPTVAAPDLTIAKSHTGNFTVGSTGNYSLTVTNGGGSSTSGTITVTDTLPSGLTVPNGAVTLGGANAANWSCNAASNVITCTSSTAIAASGTSVFNFNVNVGLGTAVGTNSVTNNASVSGGGEQNTGNNTTTDPTTILSPDLTIAKSHVGSFTVGQNGTYTLTVSNGGTAATSGTTTVTDTLPVGLTVNGGAAGAVTLGGTNAANWSCSSNAASPQVITCTSTTAIAVSGSSVFNFTVAVGANSAVGTNAVTNNASVSGGNEATSNNGNNSTTDPTTILAPDLTIAKTHTPTSFVRGSTGAYTLTVTNSGTASTSGTITVVDTLPAGLTIPNGAVTLSGANAANWSCNAASNVITCTSSTVLATSATSTFSFTVNVDANAAGTVTNTATVSGGGEPTANNGNNTATDPTNTNSPPNVQLVKSCPSPANCTTAPQLPGTDITYNIAFTNSGGQAAANMVIVDGIPANTDFKLGTATASVGTTGLTFAIEYSSDYDALNPTLATWTYTPVSGGGGASVGYDRNVKAIRWRVTSGTLSNVAPNNTGSVSFVTKIR